VADRRALPQAGQLRVQHGALLGGARGVLRRARVVLLRPAAARGEAPKPVDWSHDGKPRGVSAFEAPIRGASRGREGESCGGRRPARRGAPGVPACAARRVCRAACSKRGGPRPCHGPPPQSLVACRTHQSENSHPLCWLRVTAPLLAWGRLPVSTSYACWMLTKRRSASPV
jgi:hypothetical protein